MYNIPNGFCVTTNAFKSFCLEIKNWNVILNKLRLLDLTNNKKLIIFYKEIESLFLNAIFPVNIKKEIIRFYRSMGSVPLAVRSSSNFEDTLKMSSAGMYSSYLNILKENEIIHYIKLCYASLFKPRSLTYFKLNNVNFNNIRVAVIIQKLIYPSISGVMFSVNPVNMNNNELIIETSFGLGESIVSGKVTPDFLKFRKSNLNIIEKRINKKRIALYPGIKGIVPKYLSLKFQETECLLDNQAIDLAKIGINLERHFCKPQDVEWVIEDKTKTIYIVQTRPVTTF